MTAQNTDSRNRERLGFAEAVRHYIAPVLTARCFTCSEATPYVVKFTSPTVVLALSHAPVSYEIQVTLARKAAPSQLYTLRDILDLALGPEHKDQGFFQASERGRVFECVRAIGDILSKYGETVLPGEPAVYERMDETARHRNEAYTKQVVQGPIRKAAEKAWQEHDYAKVRDLYDSIEPDLTPVERKRLEYAKSHSCT